MFLLISDSEVGNRGIFESARFRCRSKKHYARMVKDLKFRVDGLGLVSSVDGGLLFGFQIQVLGLGCSGIGSGVLKF